MSQARRTLLVAAAILALPTLARALGVLDVVPNPVPPFDGSTLFPNWVQAPASSWIITECDPTVCTGCTTGQITGITIVNYGTATGGPGQDLTGMYFDIVCGSKAINTGIIPMTFAGNWVIGGSPTPAWTWSGSLAFSGLTDPCTAPTNGCGCAVSLFVYVDVGPCPGDGDTVELGPGENDVVNPGWPGGVTDACGYAGPWDTVSDPAVKTIQYIMKSADQTVAAPGDTVNYTIFYGRPGTGSLASITIIDTMPVYTHLAGFGAPLPDPGWDPNVGPPPVLRWTIPGPIATAGGATGMVTFATTIDWGNLESFQPGSGDVGAPEGTFLFNSAALSWAPSISCAGGGTSNQTTVVVHRYLFWLIGDNDVLFAPKFGLPDDEITYSIFIKSLSASMTWWNVQLWDTVPTQIDNWAVTEGFEDPCMGWTMTPSGCAAASPGRVLSAGKTILTWKLDLPPGFTIQLRWKGQLRNTTLSANTVINTISLQEQGRAGVVGGTGPSGPPTIFVQQAIVVLRTTFISYVGFAGTASDYYSCATQVYWLSFYPLNKGANFALYRTWCCAAAPCDTTCSTWSANGGVSPPINVFAGTCTTGPTTDWIVGCAAQRAPAIYQPAVFATGTSPSFPFNFIHKLVSNAPVVWELDTCFAGCNQDANTFVGTTSLNFIGYVAYTYARVKTPGVCIDTLYVGNTSPTQPTTAFVFQWDPINLVWSYLANEDIYNESQWDFVPPASNHYMILSSATPLTINKAYWGIGQGGAYNDIGTLAPNKENGLLVSNTAPATFYQWCGHIPGKNIPDAASVGNVGAVTASYDVYRYLPFDSTLPSPSAANITSDLVGNSGQWIKIGSGSVPPGQANAANPHVYGTNYDNTLFTTRLRYYKIVLNSGGPVQVYGGRNILDAYSGGSLLHSTNPLGQQTGRQFWVHEDFGMLAYAKGCTGNDAAIQTFDVFCPKSGMVINCNAPDGYNATYTTNNIDECVSFKALTGTADGGDRNWILSVVNAGNPGDAIAQFIMCEIGEKFYTAPFLQRGVYYEIIAPPTVFTGQNFWITVVVVDTGGGTKSDYCGTTSFTSTDPNAQMGGTGMDLFNFTWYSNVVGSLCVNGAGPNQNGYSLFFNVILTKLGLQTLIASDVTDGTITGIAAIMVVGADVKLTKTPGFLVAASGDTVQFRICWSNYSSASAFSFTLTDAVPLGMSYVPEVPSAMFCGDTDGVGPSVVVSYSTVAQATPPSPFNPAAGAPPANTQWLRWTIPQAGVGTTGCACFRVSIQ